jgi:hypothetical protein
MKINTPVITVIDMPIEMKISRLDQLKDLFIAKGTATTEATENNRNDWKVISIRLLELT